MSRNGEPGTEGAGDRPNEAAPAVAGAAPISSTTTNEPFFDQPAIRDRLFATPEVRSRLLDVPDVRSSLLRLPLVERELFDRPELLDRIMRHDDVRRRLLDDEQVRTAILESPRVRSHLLDDHDVAEIVFDDPEVVNRLFADPEVRRMIIGLPPVRRRLMEDGELRDTILGNDDIRAAIVQYGLAPNAAVAIPPSTHDAPQPSAEPTASVTTTTAATASLDQVAAPEAERGPDELDEPEPSTPREVPPPRPRTTGGAHPGGVALALGLVGTAMGVVPVLFPGALLLGVVAAIAALVGRSRAQRWHRSEGLASAGLLLSAAAIVLGVLGLLITGDAINTFDDTIDEATEWLRDVDRELSEELAR